MFRLKIFKINYYEFYLGGPTPRMFFAKNNLKKGGRVKVSLNANISITKYNMKKS